jgi:hypothetical protein
VRTVSCLLEQANVNFCSSSDQQTPNDDRCGTREDNIQTCFRVKLLDASKSVHRQNVLVKGAELESAAGQLRADHHTHKSEVSPSPCESSRGSRRKQSRAQSRPTARPDSPSYDKS